MIEWATRRMDRKRPPAGGRCSCAGIRPHRKTLLCDFPRRPLSEYNRRQSNMRALRNVRFLSAALLCVAMIGTAGFHYIEHWSWFDGFYMVLTTLTTIGYGEVHPLSQAGRYFNVRHHPCRCRTGVLDPGGIGAGICWNLNSTTCLAGGEWNERSNGCKGITSSAALDEWAAPLLVNWKSNPAQFIILESDEAKAERIREETNWLIVHADATQEPQLLAARIDQAAGLVAATTTDATNIYVVLTARSLNPAAEDHRARQRRGRRETHATAGADQVISPYGFAGFRIAQAFLRPHIITFLEVALQRSPELGLELEELTIRSVLGLCRPGAAFLRDSS